MTRGEVLKKYFGYEEFREGQETLIDSIMKGQDSVGIMPTGAGKSICYQVPALMLEGITLVISPLISLMKDQVGALNQAGVHAAYLNSSLTQNQYRLALQYAKEGRYKIIYIAPERLVTEEFLDFVSSVTISMITIDEAHCISQWGQDFRPSYLKIVEFIDILSKRPIVSAFTATATKEVREDIIAILQMKSPMVFTTTFDRPNLYFSMKAPADKFSEVRNYIQEHPEKSGIIYCATRKNVEDVYERLVKEGVLVTRYHAGLSDKERKENQDDFIYDNKPIMVATNAFGMGIDKSNVSFVIHYNMPKNMESYYQEAGRAGRDGEEAECILLYNGQDVIINQLFIENDRQNAELDEWNLRIVREKERERLKKMTLYCQSTSCLRNYILSYFGENVSKPCEKCSNCNTEFEEMDITSISKQMIECVGHARERYGSSILLQTLGGSKAAKIKQYHLDSNPCYGTLSNISQSLLRQIMNYLTVNDYLFVTNDQYPIVKLTDKSKELMEEESPILMKIAKEEEKRTKERAKKSTKAVELTSVGKELFESLRTLRFQLAKEEKVPPYLVFSDKTLIDMCKICPKTEEEMLGVAGVGEAKFEKYGSIFIDEIMAFTNGHEIETFVKEESAGTSEPEWLESSTRSSKEAKGKKVEFSLSDEMKHSILYAEKVAITEFVQYLNEINANSLEQENMKKLTSTDVTNRLLSKGYLMEVVNEETKRKRRIPSEEGGALGIITQMTVSQYGQEYEAVFYTKVAQQYIVEHLL